MAILQARRRSCPGFEGCSISRRSAAMDGWMSIAEQLVALRLRRWLRFVPNLCGCRWKNFLSWSDTGEF